MWILHGFTSVGALLYVLAYVVGLEGVLGGSGSGWEGLSVEFWFGSVALLVARLVPFVYCRLRANNSGMEGALTLK